MAHAAGCDGIFKFEPDGALDVLDVARLSDGEYLTVGDKNDEFLEVWTIAAEKRPERRGWHALAVFAASEVGFGGPVIGGVLWTRERSLLDGTSRGRLRQTTSGPELVFGTASGVAACKAYIVRLRRDGVVEADGVRLGSIRW
jgi:hypothetical protein